MARRHPVHELGAVTCNLRGSVVAGSLQTCRLVYTAGKAGIDDTGSLKVVMRYATDAGQPQFDEPQAANYTTATATNGARLALRYDLKDNVRPWGKTIHIKVLQGYLRAGDRIELMIGDRRQGSPGWQMQTFLENTFELRVLVDRYATYVYEAVPVSPTFRITAGSPKRHLASAPSSLQPGRRFVVRSKLEDAWGNPVGKPRKKTQAGFRDPGSYTVKLEDEETGLVAETNPIIVGEQATPRYWADIHGQSEETVGTNTIDQYFRFARDVGFLDISGHQGNDFQITREFWSEIQNATRRYNEPGKFVAFPGWEWSGNTGLGGDRNVFYLDEGGPLHRSSLALVAPEDELDPCAETVEELFAQLSACGRDVMLVPHVGGRYADLDRHHERLEPVVEVHSAWGTFEWMLDDAFRHGYRIGVVANSDGHKGRPGASYPGASTFGSYGGLTCVLADRLDRESVWQAYQSRHVYATTGARIYLNVRGEAGQPMGSVAALDKQKTSSFDVHVHGTAPIERIEVRNGSSLLTTIRPQPVDDGSCRYKLLWQGAEVRGRGRQVDWSGSLTVRGNRIRRVQTINFHNQRHPCTQTSERRLQWRSITTGGVAGVILELEKPQVGKLLIETAQKNAKVDIATLAARGRSYRAGGIDKRLSVNRLPSAGGLREARFSYAPPPAKLHTGDNPILLCVVQEDGQMAWSSPIYLVR